MELDPARARFIIGFFEQYLELDIKEEEELMQEISQQDNPERFTQLPISWEEKGIRKGIEQGKVQGQKKIALEMLKEDLSIDLIAKVTHMDKEAIEELRKRN